MHASGNVDLNNNALHIKPLDTTLENLTGRFCFNNGNLNSDTLRANWFGQPVNVSFTTKENPQDFGVNVKLYADWQPAKLTKMPAQVASQLSGHLPWQGDVNITLPHQGGARYDVELKGDAKEVSSRLPAPLDKASGTTMPITVNASGDLKQFELSGSVANRHRFNSRWILDPQLRVDRGIWLNDAHSKPALPENAGMVLNLPALDGEAWAGLMMAGGASDAGSASGIRSVALPGNFTLRSPAVTLAGQQWHDIDATLNQGMNKGKSSVSIQGREIRGSLDMAQNAAWRSTTSTVQYYNPEWQSGGDSSKEQQQEASQIDFSSWPALQLSCAECWLRGQKFGRIQAQVTPKGDTLALTNGLVDTGSSRLTTCQANGLIAPTRRALR